MQAQGAEAKKLCAWVGYLPLGLELLGRYLADDEDLSIQELLEELEETRLAAEALQAVAPGMTANLGVVQALELSWRELSEQARDLACVLGMFAAAPIPWELVEKCFEPCRRKGTAESAAERTVVSEFVEAGREGAVSATPDCSSVFSGEVGTKG